MSTSQLLLIAASILFLVAMAPVAGWAVSFISGYVITLGGLTTTLYEIEGTWGHYGIARSAPTLSLGDVLLAGALIAVWVQRGRLKVGWLLWAFLLPAVALLLTTWGNTPEQWSGLKLYLTAIVSFGIGRWLSENITEKGAYVLVCSCIVACGLQFTLAFTQARGVILLPLASPEAAHWIAEGRMVGLYNHPGILGRTMFLLFCFLLPLSTSGNPTTRKLAYAAIGMGSVATLLTLSRVNTFAVGVAIILWLLLSGRTSSIATRVGILGVGGALVFLNTDVIAQLQLRQERDPTGGYRDKIFDVGIEQIRSAPFTGTGPNYYSEVVGQYDRLAATGFPLHNSFLYPVAELGLPLALAFFWPLFLALAQAVRRIRSNGSLDVYSATLIALIPGIVLSAWYGWGLIAAEALPLWYMGFGFLSSRNSFLVVRREPDRLNTFGAVAGSSTRA